jgi:cytidylate kinase
MQTIIEVLKYITTGTLPPSCEKGKNFIMEPRLMGETELVAEARLKFRAFNDRPVLATRRSLLSISHKGQKFESLEQILKTRDENDQLV